MQHLKHLRINSRAIAILGIALLIGSLYFLLKISSDEKIATSLDDEEITYGMIEGPLPCSWTVSEPERVMGEDKSQGISIEVLGLPDIDCSSTISLRAPGFNISPRYEEQTITLESNQNGSLSWIISPQKTGSYEIAVADPLSTKIFGITVTDTFGLTAIQARAASIVGTALGPILTVPWWFERIRKNKKDDKEAHQKG